MANSKFFFFRARSAIACAQGNCQRSSTIHNTRSPAGPDATDRPCAKKRRAEWQPAKFSRFFFFFSFFCFAYSDGS